MDAEGFMRAAETVRKNDIGVVITSAPGGKVKVTDLLFCAYDKWEKSGDCLCPEYSEVERRFNLIALALGMDIIGELSAIRAEINSGAGVNYTVSRGEYLSAVILSKLLGYKLIDAKECVKLGMDGNVDLDSTIAHVAAVTPPCVIPGFYGKLPNGNIKLLPRGGSDISGAAIASALKGMYQKWTDVDGIFDGHGGVLDTIGYDEAEMLCYFGATILQYGSIPLLRATETPLVIKNSFKESAGTTVGSEGVKGYAFSSKRMFLCGENSARHADDIVNEGLKIPLSTSLLGRKRILVDGCSFSPLAVKRILHYGDEQEVKVTAAIGKIPRDFSAGTLIYGDEIVKLYVSQ